MNMLDNMEHPEPTNTEAAPNPVLDCSSDDATKIERAETPDDCRIALSEEDHRDPPMQSLRSLIDGLQDIEELSHALYLALKSLESGPDKVALLTLCRTFGDTINSNGIFLRNTIRQIEAEAWMRPE